MAPQQVIDLDEVMSQATTNGNGHGYANGHANGNGNGVAEKRLDMSAANAAAPPLPAEKSEKEKKKEENERKVAYIRLYRYTSAWDRFVLSIAFVCAAVQGGGWPFWSVWFGEAIGKFDPNNIDAVVDDVRDLALKFVYTGIVIGLVTMVHTWIFSVNSAKQSSRIRIEYMRSILRQDMAWHDANPSAGLDVRLTTGIPKIQEALSVKVGDCINQLFQGIIGVAISFWYSWKLTLVFMAFSPVLLFAMATFALTFQNTEMKQSKAYEKAGIIASEIFKLIRTVMAFSTYDREEKRYKAQIDAALADGNKIGRKLGFALGLPDGAIFAMYSLAFWYGSTLVGSGEIPGQDIVIVMFTTMIGFMGLGQSLTHLKLFVAGQVAAADIYDVIDRKSEIDGLSEVGEKPATLAGNVEFRGVKFAYAANPDTLILRGLDFSVKPGNTLALVGPSGSGKSTVVSLIERFYNPVGGSILLDGKPITDYNIQWLRTHVGLVTQTPSLLPATVYENIAIGKDGATEEEVIAAAKLAHAHNFISTFPEGYKTNVGDLGSQLSGGQKQRIAIARVLINNPKILLLDEATSALDNSSEKAVQAALDDAKKGRTTIAIAHRLSTIRNADNILVLRDGVLKENGNHDELIEKKGLYFEMVERDKLAHATELSEAPDEDEVVAIKAAAPMPDSPEKKKADGVTGAAAATTASPAATASTDKKELADDEHVISEEDIEKLRLDGAKGAFAWAWKMARPDAFIIAFSFLGAIITGAVWPALSIFLTQAINEVIGANRTKYVTYWCIGFLCISLVNLLGHWFRTSSVFFAGERLTHRLRTRIFHSIVHQRAEWFDDKNHSSALLMQRLSEDVSHVRDLVGDSFSVIILISVMMFGGLIVAFVSCWRTAVVTMVSLPLVAIAGVIMLKIQLSTGSEEKAAFKGSTQVGSEILNSVRLITSLGRAGSKIDEYQTAVAVPLHLSEAASRKVGLSGFFMQFANFGAFALAFYYGSVVVDQDHCSFDEMFRSLSGILFCGIMVGIFAAQIPDMKKAKLATARIMTLLLQMEDPDEVAARRASRATVKSVPSGSIEFRDVHFAYPSRPEAKVLQGLNLVIPAGKTVALVGPSGCGKSTICGLLQKLYTPNSGQILVDGSDVSTVDTEALRSHIASVDQEPRLFATSLVNNIRYGIPDGETVPEADVIDAARSANVDEFASTLAGGYDAFCGELGSRLSGGQRQRVAIARALVRADKIKILVLDEATSALDVHNERLVQDAMERARKGRTTILVAHRLSTVQSADMIVVINKGQVVEQGTHQELIQQKGFYSDLYSRHA